MKRSKGMQLGALVVASLLMGAVVALATASEPADKSAEAKNVIEKIRQDLKNGKSVSEVDLETLIGSLEQMTGITLTPIQKEEASEYIVSEVKKDLKYQEMDETFKGKTEKIVPKKQKSNGAIQYTIQSSYPVWIFVQPWVDINGGSGKDDGGYSYNINGANDLYLIETVQGSGYIKYTLWYKDEDYPDPSLDAYYDALRKQLYGRIEDKEEFIAYTNTNQIGFWGIWSNDKTFAYPTGQHGDKVFPMQAGVYINVWNHAMDINDDNPSLNDHIITKT